MRKEQKEQQQEHEQLQLQLTLQIHQLSQKLHEQVCLTEAKVTELQEVYGMIEKKEKKLREQYSTNHADQKV